MKRKIKDEFKLKSPAELKKLLDDSRELLFKLRLDKVQNKLKNQKQIFWERKKMALFLTIINEKKEAEKLTKVKEVKKKEKEENGKI